jgi:5,10-methylenetetrahydrofolate reductase
MALKEVLKSGRFVITTDFLPPKGTNIKEELKVNTSIEIAARLIRDLRSLSQGVHIYTIHWEDKVPLVLDKAGF